MKGDFMSKSNITSISKNPHFKGFENFGIHTIYLNFGIKQNQQALKWI